MYHPSYALRPKLTQKQIGYYKNYVSVVQNSLGTENVPCMWDDYTERAKLNAATKLITRCIFLDLLGSHYAAWCLSICQIYFCWGFFCYFDEFNAKSKKPKRKKNKPEEEQEGEDEEEENKEAGNEEQVEDPEVERQLGQVIEQEMGEEEEEETATIVEMRHMSSIFRKATSKYTKFATIEER